MNTVRYIVDKPFKYNGKMLKAGSEFHPSGSKNDMSIMSGMGKLVHREESGIPQRRRARKVNGKP